MEKEFEILDHTADVGIIAYGTDLSQAFAKAARALFSLITELEEIGEVLHREIVVTATDKDELLVAWLNELIYLFDTEHAVFGRFEVAMVSHTRLEARIYGERVDISRHKIKAGIKAATYHMLKVEDDNGCRVQVLFDV